MLEISHGSQLEKFNSLKYMLLINFIKLYFFFFNKKYYLCFPDDGHDCIVRLLHAYYEVPQHDVHVLHQKCLPDLLAQVKRKYITYLFSEKKYAFV